MPQASRGKNRSSKRRKQRWLLGVEMKRKYEIRSVLPGFKAMVKTKGGGEKNAQRSRLDLGCGRHYYTWESERRRRPPVGAFQMSLHNHPFTDKITRGLLPR